MKLKEVSVIDKAGSYATEFFAEVSTKPEGKYFAYELDVPETTVRSQAQTFGKTLGVKFSVVTVVGDKEGAKATYAVGITTKVRKTRVKREVAPPVLPEGVVSLARELPEEPTVEETAVVEGEE